MGEDSKPTTVRSIESLSPVRVRVNFSREMKDNIDLIDVSKYRFSNGLSVVSVKRTSPTSVEIRTSPQIEGHAYSLRVEP